MKGHTPWIRRDHPAVGAVACPYCDAPVGLPCSIPIDSKKSTNGLGRNGTHVARVRAYEFYRDGIGFAAALHDLKAP